VYEGEMNKSIHVSITASIVETEVKFSLSQMCRACGGNSEAVVELIDEGVLEPIGIDRSDWTFSGAALLRAQKAIRLQQDLGINAAGVALALDLIEELDLLKSDLRHYKTHHDPK